MTQVWIPPKDLRVRILSPHSNVALCHNRSNGASLSTASDEQMVEDVWFNIIPDTNRHRIQSMHTHHKLSMNRRAAEMTDGIELADHFFEFQPGTGSRAGTFRIVCPESSTALFARTTQEPYVGIVDARSQNDDVYFVFAPEYLEFVEMKYDIRKAFVGAPVPPKQIATGQTTNSSDTTEKVKIDLSAVIEKKFIFEVHTAEKISPDVMGPIGLPNVIDRTVTVGTETCSSIIFNKSTTILSEWKKELELEVPPRKTMKATADATEYSFDIPWTAVWRSEKTGVQAETHGIYKGVDVVITSTNCEIVD